MLQRSGAADAVERRGHMAEQLIALGGPFHVGDQQVVRTPRLEQRVVHSGGDHHRQRATSRTERNVVRAGIGFDHAGADRVDVARRRKRAGPQREAGEGEQARACSNVRQVAYDHAARLHRRQHREAALGGRVMAGTERLACGNDKVDGAVRWREIGGADPKGAGDDRFEPLLAKRYPMAEFIRFRHMSDMVNSSLKGDIAGFYAASAIVPLRLRQTEQSDAFKALEDTSLVSPIYSLVNTENKPLAGQIRQGFASFSLDDLIDIEKKWLQQSDFHFFAQFRLQIPLTETESSWLAAHPVLKIGILNDWAPMEFADTDGNPAGVTVDMLALLQQRMPIQFDIRLYDDFSQMLLALEQKDIDKLRIQMSKEQVQYVLGNPVAENSFEDNTWHYFYALKGGSGTNFEKQLIVEFKDDKLQDIKGDFDKSADFNTPLDI